MAFLLLLVFVILVLLFSLLFFLPYFFSTQISLHARCELYDTKVIYKRGNICLKFYLCWRKRDGRAKLRETKKKQSQQKSKCQKCTEYPQHTCHMYYTVRLSVHFVRCMLATTRSWIIYIDVICAVLMPWKDCASRKKAKLIFSQILAFETYLAFYCY